MNNEHRTLMGPLIKAGRPRTIQIFNRKRLALIGFIIMALFAGMAITQLPYKFQLAMIALVPAAIVGAFILINPYNGIYLYFLYEFLRPYDFIPALGPLRLAMVIEVLTLISWIFYLIKTKTRIKWDSFNWLYLGFVGVIAITVVTAMNNRLAFNMFQAMSINFLVFVLSTNIVDTPRRLAKIIWLLLFIHLYFALKGLFNFAVLGYVAEGERTSGVVGSSFIADENDFALALNVMIPFAFFLLTYSQSRLKKSISLSMLVVFVLGVVTSMSRGGWLGLVSVSVFGILRSKRKLLSFGVLSGLAILVVVFAPSDYWTQIETISNPEEATAAARISYWKAGLRMYIDNPIVGVGAGNGGVRMPEYVSGYDNPWTQWGRTFHGTIPQVMAELGTLGLVFYLLMIYRAFKYLRKVQKKYVGGSDFSLAIANAIMGSIVGYIVTATFLSTTYYPQLWTFYTLTLILYGFVKARASESRVSEVVIEEGNHPFPGGITAQTDS